MFYKACKCSCTINNLNKHNTTTSYDGKACKINVKISKYKITDAYKLTVFSDSDIIDKIIKTKIKLTNKRLGKENYLLMTTWISVTCNGCPCVDLVVTNSTTQNSSQSDFRSSSYRLKLK